MTSGLTGWPSVDRFGFPPASLFNHQFVEGGELFQHQQQQQLQPPDAISSFPELLDDGNNVGGMIDRIDGDEGEGGVEEVDKWFSVEDSSTSISTSTSSSLPSTSVATSTAQYDGRQQDIHAESPESGSPSTANSSSETEVGAQLQTGLPDQTVEQHHNQQQQQLPQLQPQKMTPATKQDQAYLSDSLHGHHPQHYLGGSSTRYQAASQAMAYYPEGGHACGPTTEAPWGTASHVTPYQHHQASAGYNHQPQLQPQQQHEIRSYSYQHSSVSTSTSTSMSSGYRQPPMTQGRSFVPNHQQPLPPASEGQTQPPPAPLLAGVPAAAIVGDSWPVTIGCKYDAPPQSTPLANGRGLQQHRPLPHQAGNPYLETSTIDPCGCHDLNCTVRTHSPHHALTTGGPATTMSSAASVGTLVPASASSSVNPFQENLHAIEEEIELAYYREPQLLAFPNRTRGRVSTTTTDRVRSVELSPPKRTVQAQPFSWAASLVNFIDSAGSPDKDKDNENDNDDSNSNDRSEDIINLKRDRSRSPKYYEGFSPDGGKQQQLRTNAPMTAAAHLVGRRRMIDGDDATGTSSTSRYPSPWNEDAHLHLFSLTLKYRNMYERFLWTIGPLHPASMDRQLLQHALRDPSPENSTILLHVYTFLCFGAAQCGNRKAAEEFYHRAREHLGYVFDVPDYSITQALYMLAIYAAYHEGDLRRCSYFLTLGINICESLGAINSESYVRFHYILSYLPTTPPEEVIKLQHAYTRARLYPPYRPHYHLPSSDNSLGHWTNKVSDRMKIVGNVLLNVTAGLHEFKLRTKLLSNSGACDTTKTAKSNITPGGSGSGKAERSRASPTGCVDATDVSLQGAEQASYIVNQLLNTSAEASNWNSLSDHHETSSAIPATQDATNENLPGSRNNLEIQNRTNPFVAELRRLSHAIDQLTEAMDSWMGDGPDALTDIVHHSFNLCFTSLKADCAACLGDADGVNESSEGFRSLVTQRPDLIVVTCPAMSPTFERIFDIWLERREYKRLEEVVGLLGPWASRYDAVERMRDRYLKSLDDIKMETPDTLDLPAQETATLPTGLSPISNEGIRLDRHLKRIESQPTTGNVAQQTLAQAQENPPTIRRTKRIVPSSMSGPTTYPRPILPSTSSYDTLPVSLPDPHPMRATNSSPSMTTNLQLPQATTTSGTTVPLPPAIPPAPARAVPKTQINLVAPGGAHSSGEPLQQKIRYARKRRGKNAKEEVPEVVDIKGVMTKLKDRISVTTGSATTPSEAIGTRRKRISSKETEKDSKAVLEKGPDEEQKIAEGGGSKAVPLENGEQLVPAQPGRKKKKDSWKWYRFQEQRTSFAKEIEPARGRRGRGRGGMMRGGGEGRGGGRGIGTGTPSSLDAIAEALGQPVAE